MLIKESVPNAPLASEENDVTQELEKSIIVDLDEPLTDNDGICEKSEESESPAIPDSNELIIKNDDDEVEELAELPDPDALHFDTVPTMEEDDDKTKEADALEELPAVALVETLPMKHCEKGHDEQDVVVEDDDMTKEADALEEPGAVDLVEMLPMEHCEKGYDEQHMVVDLDDEEDHIDDTFEAPDELDDMLDDMLDDILDEDEASPDDQLETAAMDVAVVEEPLEAIAIKDTPIARLYGDTEIQSHAKSALEDSPQTGKLDTKTQAIGAAAEIEDSSRKVAKKHIKRPSQKPRLSAASPKTPTRTSRIVTPRTSRRSDDDSTACSTFSSRKRATPRYDPNSPSRLKESTAASRSARRERHRSSDLNSYSPRKASVPIYSRQSSKVQQCCTGQLILDLHVNRAGCERCLHFSSPSERRKYDEEGRHYRINIIRGGCSRKCKLFPRTEKEPPVRLCRQCFYDTHTHGKV
jgi:hypothetical protein